MTPPTKRPQRLRTSDAVAIWLREPLRSVRYILLTRPDIRPAAMDGSVPLYGEVEVARVRHELTAIDARFSTKVVKYE